MNIACFCVLLLARCLAQSAPPKTPPAYKQSYEIFFRGSPAGTETVTETVEKDGSLLANSEHEMMLPDGKERKRLAFSTSLHLAKDTYDPIQYSYRYVSGEAHDSYEVSVSGGQISRVLNRGNRTSRVTVAAPKKLVLVDFNVYHQYDYLVRKYDLRKGGKQSFNDFLPLIGSQIQVNLTFVSDSKLEYQDGSLPVRNYQIEFVGIWIGTLSTDKNGRLVRLLEPNQQLEVLRADLLPETARQ